MADAVAVLRSAVGQLVRTVSGVTDAIGQLARALVELLGSVGKLPGSVPQLLTGAEDFLLAFLESVDALFNVSEVVLDARVEVTCSIGKLAQTLRQGETGVALGVQTVADLLQHPHRGGADSRCEGPFGCSAACLGNRTAECLLKLGVEEGLLDFWGNSRFAHGLLQVLLELLGALLADLGIG